MRAAEPANGPKSEANTSRSAHHDRRNADERQLQKSQRGNARYESEASDGPLGAARAYVKVQGWKVG